MQIISPAEPALLPSGPSRSIIAIAGTLAGFMLGTAIGGLRGAFAPSSGDRPPATPGRTPNPPLRRPPLNPPPRPRDSVIPRDLRSRRGTAANDTGYDEEAAGTGEPNAEPAAPRPREPVAAQGTHMHTPAFPAATPWQAPMPNGPPFMPAPYPAPYPLFGMPVMPPYPPAYPAGYWPGTPHPAAPAAAAAQPAEPPAARSQSPHEAGRSDHGRRFDDVESIRSGLRQVRGAIYDLAERRSRRRA